MKKLFVVLGVVAFGFAFSSCKKECECTTYLLGEVGTKTTYEIKGSEDCAKWITYDEITKTGIKCDKK